MADVPGAERRAAERMEAALISLLEHNNQRGGNYLLMMQATAGPEGTTYTWNWWWRPLDAPEGLRGDGAG